MEHFETKQKYEPPKQEQLFEIFRKENGCFRALPFIRWYFAEKAEYVLRYGDGYLKEDFYSWIKEKYN